VINSLTRCSRYPLTLPISRRIISTTGGREPIAVTKILPSKTGVFEQYMTLVNCNKLQYDEHQFKVIKLLEKVQKGIHQAVDVEATPPEDSPKSSIKDDVKPLTETSEVSAVMIPRGIYIFGQVGTGKTMMMDLFLHSTHVPKKRRVHFHKFMLEVHKIIHDYKQNLLRKYGREKNLNMDPSRDPVLHCAREIRESAQLLCFDEFQVTDIADAIIMTKLFGELWRLGTILVATSNRPPTSLYQGGLNRSYFLPFIAELEHRCIVRHLKTPLDYRTLLSSRMPGAYLTPVNCDTTAQLHDLFMTDTASEQDGSAVSIVPVMMGRELVVEARDRVCYVTFQDMCDNNRGAADYSALAKHMDTIYLQGVPVLSVLVHDKARRFITFIDEVYDAGKRLVWTSDQEPQELFQFLTPSDVKGADFGTDHSWADLEAVRGESGSQLGFGDPIHQIAKKNSVKKAVEKFEKDGGAVSMRFAEASASQEVSFQSRNDDGSMTKEEKEIKLLEGELASIQELSFAFKRAGSRLVELSGEEYFKAWEQKYQQGGN